MYFLIKLFKKSKKLILCKINFILIIYNLRIFLIHKFKLYKILFRNLNKKII